jgi:hypothetical protein
VIGHFFWRHFCNVPIRVLAEICLVSFATAPVVIDREDELDFVLESIFEPKAHPANARKEVYCPIFAEFGGWGGGSPALESREDFVKIVPVAPADFEIWDFALFSELPQRWPRYLQIYPKFGIG